MTGQTETILSEQLQTPGSESKKYRMVQRGMIGAVGIFVLCLVVLIVKPEVASNLVSLASVTIGSLTAFVTIYTGVQGYVDGKTTAALGQK